MLSFENFAKQRQFQAIKICKILELQQLLCSKTEQKKLGRLEVGFLPTRGKSYLMLTNKYYFQLVPQKAGPLIDIEAETS